MSRPRPIGNAHGDASGHRPPEGPQGVVLGLGLSGCLLQALASLSRQVGERRSEQSGLDIGPVETGAAAIAAALCTLEGRFLEVNDTLVSLSGYSREEVVGRTGGELGLWTDLQEVLHNLRVRGTVDGYLLSYKNRSGQTRRMLLAARLVTVKGRACVLAAGADVEGFLGGDEAAL
jgi:PAS domain S-box-containing protein